MQELSNKSNSEQFGSILYPVIVLLVGYITYVHKYWEPAAFFWDENFHIAAAQKYLNGIFFLEPHPPLGKLLIALGEWVVNANPLDNQYIDVEYASNPPAGFSFVGYRLFPVICSWLSGVVFYAILLQLLKRPLWALLGSSLYLFDNALIVHSRGAMLDAVLILSCLSFIFLILKRLQSPSGRLLIDYLCGVSLGAALATKLNSLFLLVFVAYAVYSLWRDKGGWLLFFARVLVGAAVTLSMIWYVHGAIARKVNPKLVDLGYFHSDAEYRAILDTGQTVNPIYLPHLIYNSARFTLRYQGGVPKLNYCKIVENGSFPPLWPLGAQAINYRWERSADGAVKYLYLQSNPAIWLCGLLGVLSGFSIIISRIYGARISTSEIAHLGLLALAWITYFGLVALGDRVFYLYHYFPPLLLSTLLFCGIVGSVQIFGGVVVKDSTRTKFLSVVALAAIGVFYYFSPLTYYHPITNLELRKRSWLSLWNLRCAECDSVNPMARPVTDRGIDDRKKPGWQVSISGVEAARISQEWGDPQQDKSVMGKELVVAGKRFTKGLGVHASSAVEFNLGGKYQALKLSVGLPDYLEQDQGSVIFEIFGDGKRLWRSGLVLRGEEARSVEVNLYGVKNLTFIVRDAGDGISHDHALWLEPELIVGDRTP